MIISIVFLLFNDLLLPSYPFTSPLLFRLFLFVLLFRYFFTFSSLSLPHPSPLSSAFFLLFYLLSAMPYSPSFFPLRSSFSLSLTIFFSPISSPSLHSSIPYSSSLLTFPELWVFSSPSAYLSFSFTLSPPLSLSLPMSLFFLFPALLMISVHSSYRPRRRLCIHICIMHRYTCIDIGWCICLKGDRTKW